MLSKMLAVLLKELLLLLQMACQALETLWAVP
jgi:hypothetical protein